LCSETVKWEPKGIKIGDVARNRLVGQGAEVGLHGGSVIDSVLSRISPFPEVMLFKFCLKIACSNAQNPLLA